MLIHLRVYERLGPIKFERASCRESAKGDRDADPRKVTCNACRRTRLFKLAQVEVDLGLVTPRDPNRSTKR